MRTFAWLGCGALFFLSFPAPGQIPVLKRSDVVFMYQADRQTYEDYGATVLAWGGARKGAAEGSGIKAFGSVGMVTEFSRYYERFPQMYEQGLCRDLEGKPYPVPWLTDHKHKGVPYWWCCTRQPLFRQYISERVAETVKGGADGVHIDDHLGTAGSLWAGGCFCDRCVGEFREFLKGLPKDELARLEIQDPASYDYRQVLREWVAADKSRKVTQHPLWPQWRIYQLRGAAQFMTELRALAARTAGHPVPMSANAGLLWGPHLNDYQALDFFSAEIEHHAPKGTLSDDPLVAYRLADAVGRPLASTASGGDWAYIKEHNQPGLVQGWIALGYAAGHSLMAPHHQWCYTPEKGTHWYEGPKEKFAPLYRFAHDHASLFDEYGTYADLTVVLSHRTLDRDIAGIIRTCDRLAAANICYAIVLGGDEVVDHPLPAEALRKAKRLLVLEPQEFSAADRALLASVEKAKRCADVDQAVEAVAPAVRLEAPAKVRLLPRTKAGAAAVHLVNWNYSAERDAVEPVKDLRLKLDLAALGVKGVTTATLFAPGAAPASAKIENASVTVPELGIWAVLQVESR